jgi:hypothetical protein
MKIFVIGLIFWVILLFPSNSFPQDTCFSEDTAKQMVVTLERAKITEQQLEVELEASEELTKQLDILKGTIKLLEEQLAIYKNMQEMNSKLSLAKDQLHEQELKAATPTFMEKLKDNVFAGGIGAAIAVVVMLVLL